MHSFYNAYSNSGNVEHMYDDNWVEPQSNTPMKDIEGKREIAMLSNICYIFLFICYLYTSHVYLKILKISIHIS